MSDIVQCTIHGNAFDMEESECAACAVEKDDEIERLRLERDNYRELWDMDHEDLRICKARIEELEYVLKAIVSNSAHIITRDQIDAAWQVVGQELNPSDELGFAEDALMKLGIERCEGCDGAGEREPAEMYQPNGDPTDPTWVKCPDCNGHGWVRGPTMSGGSDG